MINKLLVIIEEENIFVAQLSLMKCILVFFNEMHISFIHLLIFCLVLK